MAAVGAGILLGIAAALPLIKIVNRAMLTTTGVLLPADLPIFPCSLVFTAIYLLLAVFTVCKLKKITDVTPMIAIRGETGECLQEPKRALRLKRGGLPPPAGVTPVFFREKTLCRRLCHRLAAGILCIAGRTDECLARAGRKRDDGCL